MAQSGPAPRFIRIGPGEAASPVVISVPHAGRDYSEALLRAARLPREQLELLEDRYVDLLVERSAAAGVPALIATAPRAEIDLNRDEREVDAAMIAPPPPASRLLASARARGGLGLVPSRIAGAGAIWSQRLSEAELAHRISTIHRPFHVAVAEALREARQRFGVAILLDCHSMPPGGEAAAGADIVFGDRFGTSIAPSLLHPAIDAARRGGFRTGYNAPYAGGYVTSLHGRPAAGIHALQIEIDRSLYLDADLREPGPGFAAASALIEAVAEALATAAARPQSIAAE